MKKVLSFIVVAAAVFIMGCSAQNTAPSPVTLNKIGEFSIQPEDTVPELALPEGMIGNGLKVGDTDHVNRTGEYADLPWSGEALDLYVTIYNANDYENQTALIMISDRSQVGFHVDGDSRLQHVYTVTLPAYSYTVIPVRLPPDELPEEPAKHDLWILSIGDVHIDMGDGSVKKLRRAMGHKLNLISGQSYWAAKEMEEQLPPGAASGKMNLSFTSRTRIDTADEGKKLLPQNGTAAGTISLLGRDSGIAQTFLLLDYQTVPLAEDHASVLWYEYLGGRTLLSFSFDAANTSGKEVFLLTLPVGREGMPDISEQYQLP